MRLDIRCDGSMRSDSVAAAAAAEEAAVFECKGYMQGSRQRDPGDVDRARTAVHQR